MQAEGMSRVFRSVSPSIAEVCIKLHKVLVMYKINYVVLSPKRANVKKENSEIMFLAMTPEKGSTLACFIMT